MNDCLVVDQSSRPIGFCTKEEAVKLMYEGVAIVLKEDESGAALHSQHLTIPIPRVILIKNYISKRQKQSVALTARNIAIRDNKQCQYCNTVLTYDEQTIDHIKPRSRGGVNSWENLVLCCKPCNRKKADFLLDEIGMELLKKPTKPKPGIQYDQLNKLRPEWADWATKKE